MLPAESCCLTPLILDTCSRVIRVLREQYDIVGLTRAISCLFAYSEQYDIVGLTRAISCLFAYSEQYDICCFDTCELVSHRVLCQVRFLVLTRVISCCPRILVAVRSLLDNCDLLSNASVTCQFNVLSQKQHPELLSQKQHPDLLITITYHPKSLDKSDIEVMSPNLH